MKSSQSAASRDLGQKWIKRIKDEQEAHKDWIREAENAEAAYYTDHHKTRDRSRSVIESYPLFPSTIKVIHGRVFSQPPKPDVRKRYADDATAQQAQPAAGQPVAGGNPVAGPAGTPPSSAGMPPAGPNAGMGPGGLQPAQGAAGGQPVAGQVQPPTVDDNKLAQCIERAIGYTIDTTRFDLNMHMSVNDFLVTSCGIGKVEMETVSEMQPVLSPLTGMPVLTHKETGEPAPLGLDGSPAIPPELMDQFEPAMQEVIVDQSTNYRHFSWSQYHWEPRQNWNQVGWEAFDHWMTKADIEARFGVTLKTDGPTYDSQSSGVSVGGDPRKPASAKYKDQFCVHEIWDRTDPKKKQRLFVCEDYDGILGQEPDPLGLKDFFPNPMPMFLNLRGDDLVPMPDYTYCELLFDQCNELSNRISRIIKTIKEVGFYDASIPELQQARGAPPDGTYIPIAGLAQRTAQAGGKADGTINSVLARWDNQPAVAVIQELLNITEVFKQRIWEIYGVPDILRGSTDPNETATAQQIKSQWADVRIGEKVRIVALYCRDVFRIQSEIMAERFQPDILEKMTGIQLNDAEIQVLRSDYGRCYAIDVESDSTVVQDEYAKQQQTMDFVNTMISVTEKLLPAVQQGMIPADLAKEMLLTTAAAFKNGRQLEQAINALPGTSQQLGQMTTQIQTLQKQLQAANDQAAAAMKEVKAVNLGKEQRANMETMSKVQKTAADTGKTQADTAHTEVLTAAEAQGIRKSAMEPVPVPQHDNVVPMKPGAA